MLVEPLHRPARRVEPVGAAAREHDRVHDLDVVDGIEQIRLARARRAAAHVAAADRPVFREDDRAAGGTLRQREVADRDAVDGRERGVLGRRRRRLPRREHARDRQRGRRREQHHLHADSV
jgi:hypothetical protein